MFNYHVYEVVIGNHCIDTKQDENITYEVVADNLADAITIARKECWTGKAISARYLRDIPKIKEINRVLISRADSEKEE
ncbi:MAG: hypothetical protein IJP63_06655 [Acholeplasmatales bacterium]|nr:hypothetical protein [Acholeplasmatales bacterium]